MLAKDKEKGKDEDRSRSRKKGDSQRDKSKSRKEVTSQEAGAEAAKGSKPSCPSRVGVPKPSSQCIESVDVSLPRTRGFVLWLFTELFVLDMFVSVRAKSDDSHEEHIPLPGNP